MTVGSGQVGGGVRVVQLLGAWMISDRLAGYNSPTQQALVLVAWREFLSRVPWDYFLTLTISPVVRQDRFYHPDMPRTWKFQRSGMESWLRAWRWFLYTWVGKCAVAAGQAREEQISRSGGDSETVFKGPWANAWSKGRGQPMWVLALEPHRDNRLHAHVLVKMTRSLEWLDYRVGQDLWRKGHDGRPGRGVCWFEKPRSQEHVTCYVAKYVVKTGSDALTFSPNFDAARMTCSRAVVASEPQ